MADMQQADPARIRNQIMADRMAVIKKPFGKEYHAMCKEIETMEYRVTEDAAVKAAQMVLELGGSKDTATAKIVEKFSFSFENAKECVEKAIKS